MLPEARANRAMRIIGWPHFVRLLGVSAVRRTRHLRRDLHLRALDHSSARPTRFRFGKTYRKQGYRHAGDMISSSASIEPGRVQICHERHGHTIFLVHCIEQSVGEQASFFHAPCLRPCLKCGSARLFTRVKSSIPILTEALWCWSAICITVS